MNFWLVRVVLHIPRQDPPSSEGWPLDFQTVFNLVLTRYPCFLSSSRQSSWRKQDVLRNMKQTYDNYTLLHCLCITARGVGLQWSKPPAEGPCWLLPHRGRKGHAMSKSLLPPSCPPVAWFLLVRVALLSHHTDQCKLLPGFSWLHTGWEKGRIRMMLGSRKKRSIRCPFVLISIAWYICLHFKFLSIHQANQMDFYDSANKLNRILLKKKTNQIQENLDMIFISWIHICTPLAISHIMRPRITISAKIWHCKRRKDRSLSKPSYAVAWFQFVSWGFFKICSCLCDIFIAQTLFKAMERFWKCWNTHINIY